MKLTDAQIKKVKSYFKTQKDILAAYLYGSYARGNPHKRSDIDIAVLFKGKVNLYRRLGQLFSEVNSLGLNAEAEIRQLDLNQSPVYLMNVIQGELIFSRDESKRVDFEVKVMNIVRDTEYLRKLKYEYMDQSFQEGTYGYRLFNN